MKMDSNVTKAGAVFIGVVSAAAAVVSTVAGGKKRRARIERDLLESADRIEKLESLSPDKRTS